MLKFTLLPMTDLAPLPVALLAKARPGNPVTGAGGSWVPLVVEVAPGRYCAGLGELRTGRPALYAAKGPLWTCPDSAMHHAVTLAALAAG